jgi:hypothetical protein
MPRLDRWKPHAIVLIHTPTSIWMSHIIGMSSLRIELSGNPHTYLREALAKLSEVHPHFTPRGLVIMMKPDFCIEYDLEGRVVAIDDIPRQLPVTYLETIH